MNHPVHVSDLFCSISIFIFRICEHLFLPFVSFATCGSEHFTQMWKSVYCDDIDEWFHGVSFPLSHLLFLSFVDIAFFAFHLKKLCHKYPVYVGNMFRLGDVLFLIHFGRSFSYSLSYCIWLGFYAAANKTDYLYGVFACLPHACIAIFQNNRNFLWQSSIFVSAFCFFFFLSLSQSVICFSSLISFALCFRLHFLFFFASLSHRACFLLCQFLFVDIRRVYAFVLVVSVSRGEKKIVDAESTRWGHS